MSTNQPTNNQQNVFPMVFLFFILAALLMLLMPRSEPIQRVYFVEPQDGAIVGTTFNVKMGAWGFDIRPAGELGDNIGHFHIMVNADFVPAGQPIPADEHHLHYGKAQAETTLTLEPGTYKLRLQLADGAHIAQEGDQYRDEILITVEDQ